MAASWVLAPADPDLLSYLASKFQPTGEWGYTARMQRKIFWITFGSLGLLADLVLPLWWALAATIPLLALSWWFAYRSDWFE